MENIECPDWLVDGASVLVYSHAGHASGHAYCEVHETTVKRVSTTSFTIHDAPGARVSEPRIRIRGLQSVDFRRKVVPLESDEAREILARDAHDNAILRAHGAVRVWQKEGTRETRLAAINALQAIDQHEACSR